MQQARFTNKPFYIFILAFISLLTAWQFFILLATSGVFGIVPIVLQILLLFVLVGEHRYSKQFLRYWAGIFIIFTESIKIVAKMLASSSGGSEFLNFSLFINIAILLFGILIFFLAGIFIEITNIET